MQAIKTRLTDYHIKIKPSMKLINFICTIKFDDHFSGGTDDYENDIGFNNAMPENLKNIIFELTNQQNITTTATSSTTAKTTTLTTNLNNDNDNNFSNDIIKNTNHNTTRNTIDNKLLTDRKNEISSTKKPNLSIKQMKCLNEIKLNDIEIVEILKDIDENLINNQRKIQRNYEQQQHVFQSQSQSQFELKQQQLEKQKMLQQQKNLINKVNKLKNTEIETNYNDYNTDEQNKFSNLNENESRNDESDNINLEIELNDLIWLKKYLNKKLQMEMNNKNDTELSSLNIAYLHELLNDCEIILPKNEIIYEKLTTTKVNNDDSNYCKNRNHHHNEYEYENENDDEKKSLINTQRATELHINGKISFKNRIKYYVKQLFAILQFISIICIAFIFGFYGINNILIIDNFDYGFRLLLGVIFALITALSQLYNLAMKLVQYNDDIIREKYFEEKEKKD